jgi:hypothetical protein
VILAALHLSAGFMTPLVQPGMLRSSAASRGLLSLACDRRPPVAPARLASSAVPQNMASGDGGGGKGKWGDPPVEIVDDAVDRAVTLIKASGGSMDSLSFGAAWKVAYPTYDKDVFKNTCVTSFTKLLQVRLPGTGLAKSLDFFVAFFTNIQGMVEVGGRVLSLFVVPVYSATSTHLPSARCTLSQRYAQDDILVESTAKKEVKIYKLKDAKVGGGGGEGGREGNEFECGRLRASMPPLSSRSCGFSPCTRGMPCTHAFMLPFYSYTISCHVAHVHRPSLRAHHKGVT